MLPGVATLKFFVYMKVLFGPVISNSNKSDNFGSPDVRIKISIPGNIGLIYEYSSILSISY